MVLKQLQLSVTNATVLVNSVLQDCCTEPRCHHIHQSGLRANVQAHIDWQIDQVGILTIVTHHSRQVGRGQNLLEICQLKLPNEPMFILISGSVMAILQMIDALYAESVA